MKRILFTTFIALCSCTTPGLQRNPAQADQMRTAEIIECNVQIGEVKSFTEFDVSNEAISKPGFPGHSPRKETLKLKDGAVNVAYSLLGLSKQAARVNVAVRSSNNELTTLLVELPRFVSAASGTTQHESIRLSCRSLTKEISVNQPATYGSNSSEVK